jgi:hypothetical protein
LVYNNSDEREIRGRIAKESIVNMLNPKRTANEILTRIKNISYL